MKSNRFERIRYWAMDVCGLYFREEKVGVAKMFIISTTSGIGLGVVKNLNDAEKWLTGYKVAMEELKAKKVVYSDIESDDEPKGKTSDGREV